MWIPGMKKLSVRLAGICLALVFTVLFTVHTHALTKSELEIASNKGWHSLPGGKITYIRKDLTPASGFMKIDGSWYHFDKKGYLSLGWFTEKKNRYYARTNGKTGAGRGALLSGYAKAKEGYYQFSSKNKAGSFGAQTLGFVKVDDKVFCYGPDGEKYLGLKKVNDRLYYFDPSGNAKNQGCLRTGWVQIGEKKYYFRSTGKVGKKYGSAYQGTSVKINGRRCRFKKNGCYREPEIQATASQKRFIEKIGALAHEDMKSSGILASVTVAQAIVESGFGTSVLAKHANNLFGMKASLSGSSWKSVWKGKTYKKSTGEYINGSYTTIVASFRKYPDIKDSVADHSAYLNGARLPNGKLRYKGVKGCRDYKKAAAIIRNGGYATALNYVSALVSVIERYDLVRYDEEILNADSLIP